MQKNWKIGIVLAGGMSKGAYEIGCLKALGEYFDQSNFACVSASSIGVPIGYAFLTGRLNDVISVWKELDISETGRFFPNLSGNPLIAEKIRGLVSDVDEINVPFYATLWNFSKQKAEYALFNSLTPNKRKSYMIASISIPVFGKGVRLNGDIYFDGAFLDNIPVYPMLEKNLDAVFCIYFDRKDYLFENVPFDNKVIKLNCFPIIKRWKDNFVLDPERVDSMVEFGYSYCKVAIEEIFSQENLETAIKKRNRSYGTKERRATADTILSNINRMTTKFAPKKIL